MSTESTPPDLASMAGSIGLLIDRVGAEDEVLGSVWLIDANKVATCAHLITLYGDKLEALKVFFPAAGQSHGISQALFHPRFNRKHANKLATDGLWDSLNNMHLQNYNAAVLTLTPQLNVLSAEQINLINQKLTISPPQIEQGLGGNLGEIDFFLVIQTITNARKEGLIIISDGRNRPVARLFCQNGRITHAIYRNLTNELAVYQIVQRRFKGNFFFQAKTEPDWPTERAIARPPEMLLLEAHRRMDELEKFTASLGGSDAVFCRAIPWINDSILPAEVAETARNLWPHLDGSIPIGSLWQVANVDDYAVYHALVELFKTRQIENVDDTNEFQNSKLASQKAKIEPLVLVSQAPLLPGDEIDNLSVDSRRGHARIKKGMLLGSLISEDPYHLLHNLSLLPESCGTPMFMNGVVIGMHCGPLPAAPELDEQQGSMQQMLWSECVIECLKDGGEVELAKRLSLSGEAIVKKMTQETPTAFKRSDVPGCREVARVDCSKCGKTHLEGARFCKSCGQRLVQDVQYRPPTKVFSQAPLVVVTLLFMGVLSWGLLTMLPARPQFVHHELSYIPEVPWVSVATFGVNKLGKPEWGRIPDGAALNNNVIVYFDVKVNEPVYLYVLSDGPTSISGKKDADASLHLPEKNPDHLWQKGDHFTVPKETQKVAMVNGRKGLFMNGLVTGPADTTILIASRMPLPLIGNQANQNLVFAKANGLLSLDRFSEGIEAPISKVAPNLFPPSVKQPPGDLIYLKRLMEKIPTD